MKQIFYVRHGETGLNAARVLSGQRETPLTKKGIQQAEKVAGKIKKKLPPIDLIVCSPLGRCRETARIIAQKIEYPAAMIMINDLLIERAFGVLEGQPADTFYIDHHYQNIDDIEGVEKLTDLDGRAADALEYLRGLPQETILVVGHGSFGRAIVRASKGLPSTDEYESKQTIDNADIIELA